VSEAFSQWNENVELVNYPIRQKTCLGVVEEGILYGNTRIGVEIFDVSDPANMVEMGNLPLAHNYPLGTNYVTSPWIGLHDGHLYIRAETPASVDSFDIYIVDVNEPQQPVVVLEWETGRTNMHFWLSGGFLFYPGNDSLTRFDLADPANPRELDTITPFNDTEQVACNGTYLFGGGAVIDFSGEQMVRTGNFPYQRFLAIQDSIIAVIAPGTRHLRLFDFDPPGRVTHLCDTLTGLYPRMNGNYWINGQSLYIMPDEATLQTVDISDPHMPRVVDQFVLRDDDRNLLDLEIFARDGNIIFLIERRFPNASMEKLYALDVHDPGRIRKVGELMFHRVRINKAFCENPRLYLNSTSARFCWELIGPFNVAYRSCFPPVHEVGWEIIGGTFALDDLVYGVKRNRGNRDVYYLQTVDYSTPEFPASLFEIPIPHFFSSYTQMPANRLINERYLFLSYTHSCMIFDLIDPERPELMVRVDELPRYISVISDEYAIGTELNSLELWSLVDLNDPQLVDSDSLERTPRAIAANGNTIYVFCQDSETSLFPVIYQADINTDQLNLIARGESCPIEHLSGRGSGTVLNNGLVVYTCNDGFLIWDMEDPLNPHFVGSHLTHSGESIETFAAGDDIVLNDRYGIGWFRLQTTNQRPHLLTDRDFPFRTNVGECDTMHLQLANMSDEGLLHINRLSIDGDGFEIEPYGQWIKSGEMWQRKLLFRPDEITHYEADLMIHLAEGEPIVMQLSGFGVSDSAPYDDSPLPLTTRLLSCSPNPFNAKTTIAFDLEKPARVQITLFDLQGRKLQTILDRKFAGGHHRTTWSAFNLVSGMYFLIMDVEGCSFRQRVVIIE